MTKIKENYNIDDIKNLIKNYTDSDCTLIDNIYNYVVRYLNETELKDMLNISYLLTTVNADIETICASFLYQLLMKECVKRSELDDNFDNNIVRLAYGTYKLNKISLSTENDYLVEYYKKVIVGMSCGLIEDATI